MKKTGLQDNVNVQLVSCLAELDSLVISSQYHVPAIVLNLLTFPRQLSTSTSVDLSLFWSNIGFPWNRHSFAFLVWISLLDWMLIQFGKVRREKNTRCLVLAKSPDSFLSCENLSVSTECITTSTKELCHSRNLYCETENMLFPIIEKNNS